MAVVGHQEIDAGVEGWLESGVSFTSSGTPCREVPGSTMPARANDPPSRQGRQARRAAKLFRHHPSRVHPARKCWSRFARTPVRWLEAFPRQPRPAELPPRRRSCRRRPSSAMARFSTARSIAAWSTPLPRRPPGFFRLALPLRFRLLCQMFFQQQAMFRRQPLNAFENFVDGFTHGNTSNRERRRRWSRRRDAGGHESSLPSFAHCTDPPAAKIGRCTRAAQPVPRMLGTPCDCALPLAR